MKPPADLLVSAACAALLTSNLVLTLALHPHGVARVASAAFVVICVAAQIANFAIWWRRRS